jgi:general secretion pathway protein B
LVRPIEAPAVAPATIPPQAAAQAAQDEVLPTQMDLAAGGTSLPEMHLDIHVYSAKPADRFVFVNMRKYTEGQALKEGPTLERITPDGAILNQHGLRFLLPRQ